MKKLKIIAILLFAFYATLSFGQAPRAGRIWQSCGIPTGTKPNGFNNNQDILADTCGGKFYTFTGLKWTENEGFGKMIKGPAGKDGKDGLSITGPVGPQGPAGVCPDCPPSGGGSGTITFPFIIIQPSGGDDTPAWKAAFAQNKSTGKAIYPFGTTKINTDLIADIDHFGLWIVGNGAKLQITATGPMTAIKRRAPVDNSQALNVGTFARWNITGLTIIGNGNQNGIDCGPQYGANISDNYFDGLKRPIWAKFALKSKFLDNIFVNCYDGCIVDVGDWPNATNFNSQSNSCEVSGRYYGNSAVMAAIRESIPNYRELLNKQFDPNKEPGERVVDVYSQIQQLAAGYRVTSGGVAFGFYGVSGGILRDFIVEGVSAGAAVDFDGLGSTVVKDFTVQRGHIEMVNGFSAAAVNLRILGGIMTIDKLFSQYPAMFMDASSSSGIGFVQVNFVPWWVPKNNKYFKTSNISMDFKYNEAFRGINSSMWEGTSPTVCTGASCGYHKYTFTDIPR